MIIITYMKDGESHTDLIHPNELLWYIKNTTVYSMKEVTIWPI